jgi:Mlc titration factor MtfA (ptsG expression regulator)
LTPSDRRELAGHVHVLLDEKGFEGAGGLVLTEEMILQIAALASLMLLHRETDYYPTLRAIIVYPDTYLAPRREWRGMWIELEQTEVMAGESWAHGAVVLSWAEVYATAAVEDCVNLALHEFAHQLDEEDGAANGAPLLGSAVDPDEWARVMREAYGRLRAATEQGEETVLNPYGTESPAEFFAVATEAFFECGTKLRVEYPELYEQLRRYFQQDPASWKLRSEVAG